jgi:hypothetical protein
MSRSPARRPVRPSASFTLTGERAAGHRRFVFSSPVNCKGESRGPQQSGFVFSGPPSAGRPLRKGGFVFFGLNRHKQAASRPKGMASYENKKPRSLE